MSIYNEQQLVKQNFFQRLFKVPPKDNACIEINNLFAQNQGDLMRIQLNQITEIAQKYKLDLDKEYKQSRLDLFSKYLKYCVEDRKLEDKEIKVLKHIQELLLLSEDDTKTLISIETDRIYQTQVEAVIRNGKVDSFEKENLEKLRQDLLIPDKIASKIFEKSAKERLQEFLDNAISDERISPEEETELLTISNNLGIEFDANKASKGKLEKFKLYWQLENSALPELMSDINLQKNEILHFHTEINWYEQRRVTKRINYGGPIARIKIAKGIYYRLGSVGVQPVSEDVLQMIDSGKLYLTNKRVIFMGARGNKTININKILDFLPYKNGVDLQKDSGKSPFLEFEDNIDVFSLILVRLMNEN